MQAKVYQTTLACCDHGICRCGSCRKRFKDWCGLDLPTKEDGGDVVFRKYQEFKRQTSDVLFEYSEK
ncbi:MAG: hypothetical protein KAY65_00610 [Planctomycetes bacterium]|nr:hypothetical protein [Planctomycetota bacterium]